MLFLTPDEKNISLYRAFILGVMLGFLLGMAYMGKIIYDYEKELIIKEYKLETARKFIADHLSDLKFEE